MFHLAVADVFLGICWIVGAALWEQPMLQSFPFKACTILQAVTEVNSFTASHLHYFSYSRFLMLHVVLSLFGNVICKFEAFLEVLHVLL